jgi:hypothetical protein
VICLEKKRLMDELAGVMKSILDLHTQEAQAVIDGDYSTHPALTLQLKNEHARRASLLAELKAHTGTHSC